MFISLVVNDAGYPCIKIGNFTSAQLLKLDQSGSQTFLNVRRKPFKLLEEYVGERHSILGYAKMSCETKRTNYNGQTNKLDFIKSLLN